MIPVGPPDAVLAPAFAAALALIHLFAGRLGFSARRPRSRWLSVAGGISVAYVFVHLLPEIGEAAATLERRGGSSLFAEQYGYLIALFGFVAFYGLEQLARRGNVETSRGNRPDETALFWIHVGSFAVYNGIIGYLLLDRELGGLVTFFVAMALHFVVTDAGLREHHGPTYDRRARWVLATAVLVGFAGGYALEDADLLIAVFVPFLAGGVILNVIKEELPSDRESRFWAFALGGAGYAALLLFV
ncbi:hypothetical protein GS429_06125 [Natronorubrum sp. JWXQ-INN-674]|uniref:ZIP family metal transporter n=1 Tax=Natronorubrum halalkaliphilum TaxID=2691917 RepID=A0A6B0VKW1_9EURY|nr:hypothetical protein [Natronorubrum halalkaliphilum]MXV61646.1 hypothetical protein [Natronorubrum halalkaliphilum]